MCVARGARNVNFRKKREKRVIFKKRKYEEKMLGEFALWLFFSFCSLKVQSLLFMHTIFGKVVKRWKRPDLFISDGQET